MSAPATVEQVERLERRVAELTEMLRPVLSLAVRQRSRKEQARKAGISIRTLQRRERKARAKLAVGGAL